MADYPSLPRVPSDRGVFRPEQYVSQAIRDSHMGDDDDTTDTTPLLRTRKTQQAENVNQASRRSPCDCKCDCKCEKCCQCCKCCKCPDCLRAANGRCPLRVCPLSKVTRFHVACTCGLCAIGGVAAIAAWKVWRITGQQ